MARKLDPNEERTFFELLRLERIFVGKGQSLEGLDPRQVQRLSMTPDLQALLDKLPLTRIRGTD